MRNVMLAMACLVIGIALLAVSCEGLSSGAAPTEIEIDIDGPKAPAPKKPGVKAPAPKAPAAPKARTGGRR